MNHIQELTDNDEFRVHIAIDSLRNIMNHPRNRRNAEWNKLSAEEQRKVISIINTIVRDNHEILR